MSNGNKLIKKTKNENSFFVRAHATSNYGYKFFSDKPEYNGKEVKILQIMQIEEGYLIFECVYVNN